MNNQAYPNISPHGSQFHGFINIPTPNNDEKEQQQTVGFSVEDDKLLDKQCGLDWSKNEKCRDLLKNKSIVDVVMDKDCCPKQHSLQSNAMLSAQHSRDAVTFQKTHELIKKDMESNKDQTSQELGKHLDFLNQMATHHKQMADHYGKNAVIDEAEEVNGGGKRSSKRKRSRRRAKRQKSTKRQTHRSVKQSRRRKTRAKYKKHSRLAKSRKRSRKRR